MANQKVPQLPVLSAVTGDDLFYVVDVSDTTDDPTGSSKQITRDNILKNITGLTINGNLTVTGNTQSLFSGNTSSDLVRLTQTGSGNAFVVEDATSPDSTVFVINNVGRVGVGTTAAETLNSKVTISNDYTGTTNGLYIKQLSSGYGLNVLGFSTAINTYVEGTFGGAYGTTDYPVGLYSRVTDGIDAIAIKGFAESSEFGTPTTLIGGHFYAGGSGYGALNQHSVWLQDGTEGINKVLISKTSDGKANWSSTLTGLTSVSATSVSATTFYGSGTNLTGVVKGSGTTNYLPRWTGTTELGNSIIRDDGTNVGVNIAPTTGAKFKVLATTANTYSVHAQGGTSTSVWGENTVSNGTGVYGSSSQPTGTGVYGSSNGGYGVYASSSSSGYGVLIGIDGSASGFGASYSSPTGVKGSSNGEYGAIGVYGYASESEFGTGVYLGGKFVSTLPSAGGTNYSVQLMDGTEGINKVLISKTSDGKANWSSNLTGLTSISATTYYNLPTDIRVTGGTYSSGTATFRNNTGGTFSVTGFTNGGSTFTGGTVTGATNFTGGLTANTISATTYYNLPTDIRVTGATYLNNTFTYTNNTGGTFNVLFNTMTGLTISGNLTVTGGTQSIFSGNSSSDLVRVTQTGSGNAFVVEDSTSPDSTAFVINNVGDTGIGTTPNSSYKLIVSGASTAIRGESTSQTGVDGVGYIGVKGTASSSGATSYGVQGVANGVGAGVFGWNLYGTGYGVLGNASGGSGIGVQGNGGTVGVKGSVSSDGSPIGVYGYVTDIEGGGTDYIAGKFEAAAGTNRYSLQLLDGTQGVNKVLISTTSDGKANWSSNLTGLTSISATTYYNLPTDIRVTGGTYSGGTTIFTNNTGGTFSVSGFNTSVSPISVVNTSSLFSTGLSNTGLNSSGVTHSIFMGSFAGYQATGASASNFFGYQSGFNAIDAMESNFIGPNSGYQASGASASNFFGNGTGANAYNALHSNFIGTTAGSSAYNAYYSNFIGYSSGENANNASYSNLFGFNVGKSFTNNNIGSNNVIIGTNISLPSGATNSINIGGVLFGVGTYSATTGNPSISGNTIGRIGIGVVNPTERLHVSGNTLIQGGLTADTISATTYYNLPTDIRVTGGTFSAGTATFTNNTGGTFSVSGFSTTFTGGTVSGATNFTGGLTANTISATTISGNNIDSVNQIDFNTNPTTPSPTGGTMYYDYNENALSYKPITNNNDVTVNLGQESLIRIYNDLGYQINNGQVVHITGSTSGVPTVALANASKVGTTFTDSLAQSSGVATHDIPNGEYGFITNFGLVRDLNTTAFTAGQEVFLSDTVDGGLTNNPNNIAFTSRISVVGYCVESNATTGKILVSITNENPLQSLTQQEVNVLLGNTISTGVYSYTGATTASTTTINVSPMRGWLVYNTGPIYSTNPSVLNVYYSGGTNVGITNIGSADATYLLVNSGGTLYQQTTFPSPQERRENIFLGKVVHPNRSTILAVNNTVDYDVSPMSALRDLWSPIKIINDGVLVTPNGSNLNINTSSGTLWSNGIGWTTNELNPNSVTISAKVPASFFYRTQTGGTSSTVTVIDPTKYDVGGVITSVGGAASNDATNQRVYLYPTGTINVLYGQTVYNTLSEAVAGIQSETFVVYPNAKTTGVLIGVISVRNDIVADGQPLTNTDYAIFTPVSKFGELLGGTAGLSTTTLQQAYNNSTTPEIITNSTLGAVSIKNGAGTEDNITSLFETLNSGGTTTMFVRADGYVSGTTFYSGGFTANGTGVTATTVSATTVYTNGFTANTTGVSATTISGGALNISGNTSEDLVRITQTGSGNALVVEDSSNPDSTPFVVNTSGFVGIGVTSPTNPLHISGSTDQIKLSNGSSVWTIASKSNGDFVAVASGTRASMYFGSYGTTNSMRINSTGNIIVNSTNDSQFVGGGNVIINNGLSATTISATTISATTYQNLPTDIRVTGGTYYDGSITFTNNTGGTFSVTIPSNFSAGPISGSTGWSSTGSGQMNLPEIKVALYDNSNNYEPVNVYSVSSGTTGSGGIPSLTDNDTNYVVVEYNGGSPIYNVYDNDGVVNDSSVVLVYIVYRLGNFVNVLEFGDFGAGLPNKLNDRLMMTDRFGRESGLSLGLSGSTGVVTATEGVAWNASYRQSLAAVNSQDDIFFKNYHSGGTWTYTTTGDTLNNTYYDNGTNIVELTAGKYLVNWYFRGQEVNDHLYEVYGNDEYDSVSEAELSVEPLLPELITSHAFLLGRIIVLKSATTGVTQSAFVKVFQSTQVENHNDLIGLQGGGPGEYYHLTSSQYNNLPYKNSGNTFTQKQIFSSGVTVTGNTQSLFSGNTSSGDTSSDLVRIIQTGTGNAFVVEDSSPDSTKFVIDNGGNVIIGSVFSDYIKLNSNGTIYAQTYSTSAVGVEGWAIDGTGVRGFGQNYGGEFLSRTIGVKGYAYEDGGSIGVYGLAGDYEGGYGDFIGGKFESSPTSGNKYSVQLKDGTEGLNKVLVSQTSDGKANWVDPTTIQTAFNYGLANAIMTGNFLT